MKPEAEELIASSTLVCQEKLGYAEVYTLKRDDKKFYVCISGIGKVLAGIAAASCCLRYPEIDAFVNLGIGGSLDAEKAPCLSAVVGNLGFVQHDMDTSAFGDPIGYLNGLDEVVLPSNPMTDHKLHSVCESLGVPCCNGAIASGDQFIVDEKAKQAIVDRFGCLCIDMEAAAFAEACHVYEKGFSALRIISDAVDHHAEYVKNKPLACSLASKVGMALIDAYGG